MSLYIDKKQPSHYGGPNPNLDGWIYIAYDCRHLDESKIGFTTKSLWGRVQQSTTNPYYTLFAAFHVSAEQHGEIRYIEHYLQKITGATSIQHHSTGSESEWFNSSPDAVLSQMVGKAVNVLKNVMTEDLEFDYTKHVYIPNINPYAARLKRQQAEDFKRFSAPDIFIYDLEKGWSKWPERPNFLAELAAIDIAADMLVAGPDILVRRLNYDYALR